jgi:hypothetical protein
MMVEVIGGKKKIGRDQASRERHADEGNQTDMGVEMAMQ